MKRIRKIFQAVLVITMVVFMSSLPVLAKEAVSVENEAVTISSIPDGFTLIGTFERSPKTYSIGTFDVQSTSTFQLYLPDNGRQDWIQGYVEFSGISTQQFEFTNLSGEYKTFDLSVLTPGIYEVRVYAYAFGTSSKAMAYYKMNY